MDAKTAAFDQMFGQLATNVGNVSELLERFFSFLNRRTDFYIVDPSRSAKMGFAPGHAERLLLETFHKFPLKGVDGRAFSPAAQSGSATSQVQARKAASVSSKVLKQKIKRAKGTKQKHADSKGGATADKARSEAAVATTAAGTGLSGLRPRAKETTTKGKRGSKSIGINQVWTTQKLKQLPHANGGAGPGYWWSQTIDEVTLNVPVPKGTRSKDVSVQLASNRIAVALEQGSGSLSASSGAGGGAKSQEPRTLLEGELGGDAAGEDGDEMLWVLDTKAGSVSIVEIGASQVAFEALAKEALLRASAASGPSGEGGSVKASSALSADEASVDAPVQLASSTSMSKVLQVTISKSEETWWGSAIRGHPEIDATRVDSSKHVSEYDIGTQSTIRRLMEDQARKAKGLPSVEEEQAQRTLEKAMELPGSPFAGTASSAAPEERGGNGAAEQGDDSAPVPRYGTGGTVSDPMPEVGASSRPGVRDSIAVDGDAAQGGSS